MVSITIKQLKNILKDKKLSDKEFGKLTRRLLFIDVGVVGLRYGYITNNDGEYIRMNNSEIMKHLEISKHRFYKHFNNGLKGMLHNDRFGNILDKYVD